MRATSTPTLLFLILFYLLFLFPIHPILSSFFLFHLSLPFPLSFLHLLSSSFSHGQNPEAPEQGLHQHYSHHKHHNTSPIHQSLSTQKHHHKHSINTDLRQPISSTPLTPISIKIDLHQHRSHRSPSTHHRSPSTPISIKTDLHQHRSPSTHHRSPSTPIQIAFPIHDPQSPITDQTVLFYWLILLLILWLIFDVCS